MKLRVQKQFFSSFTCLFLNPRSYRITARLHRADEQPLVSRHAWFHTLACTISMTQASSIDGSMKMSVCVLAHEWDHTKTNKAIRVVPPLFLHCVDGSGIFAPQSTHPQSTRYQSSINQWWCRFEGDEAVSFWGGLCSMSEHRGGSHGFNNELSLKSGVSRGSINIEKLSQPMSL